MVIFRILLVAILMSVSASTVLVLSDMGWVCLRCSSAISGLWLGLVSLMSTS